VRTGYRRLVQAAALVAIAATTLPLGGCGAGSDRIRFADEGGRCSDSQVLYVDDSGDELYCEGFKYKGPLTPDEKRETLRLASRLASDGSLSGKDKDRVRKFAEHPPALARTHLVPRSVLAAGGKVWVLGQAEDASYHVAEIDPASSEVTTLALTPKSIAGFAIAGSKLWLYGDGIWSGRAPVWQVDLARPDRVDELIVFENGSASIGAVAPEGETLWVGLSIVGDEGVGSARVERFDLRRRRVISSVDLPGESSVRSIAFTSGAVWVDGDDVWKIDSSGTRAQPVDLGIPTGHMNASSGAVWVASQRLVDSPWVGRVDPATRKVVASVKVGPGIKEIETGAGAVWILREGGELLRIDPATNHAKLVATLDMSGGAGEGRSLALTDEAAWVALDSGGRLARVDAASGRVTIRQLSVEYALAE